jgi:hypothetical protein
MGIRVGTACKMQATSLYSCDPEKCGRHTGRYSRLVLGEKLALARIGVWRHVTVRCLEARLARPSGSVFALLLRDGAYDQGYKGCCYSHCHFRFDG